MSFIKYNFLLFHFIRRVGTDGAPFSVQIIVVNKCGNVDKDYVWLQIMNALELLYIGSTFAEQQR